MIVFQDSSNFDPVKGILKMRCHIYILMKKVIILRKIHENGVFRGTILQLFQFESEQKTRGNESSEKETKHIHNLVADLLHVRIGNLDCSAREASRHLAFCGHHPDY